MDIQSMADLIPKAPPDRWDPIFAQRALQEFIRTKRELPSDDITTATGRIADLETLTEAIKVHHTAASVELAELLDQLPWKPWKTYDFENLDDVKIRTEAMFEIVDIFHFLANMVIVLGFSWEDVLSIWYTKNQENFARQERGY